MLRIGELVLIRKHIENKCTSSLISTGVIGMYGVFVTYGVLE